MIAPASNRPVLWQGPAFRRAMSPLNAIEFLKRDFPPRDMLLAPWLPTQGLCMIYGPRGLGKTHVSLNVAYAVATGGEFLGWKAPQPRRVLFIDGEMPGALLQERLAAIVAVNREPDTLDFLKILSADAEPDGLPDLSDTREQAYYEPYLDDADVIVVDNLSTICRGLRENEADSWGGVQFWALQMRRAGKTVVFIHHSGKSGGQRGTSKKEDVLDTVIALRRPSGYSQEQGSRFEVHFEKARSVHGEDARPFQAHLVDGTWIKSEIVDEEEEEVLRLKAEGRSIRDIAAKIGVSKSAVGRMVKESSRG